MFRSLILGFSAFAFSVFAAGPTASNVSLDKAFVPVGFDDNDRVEITIEGKLASTCYKVGEAQVRVDEHTQQVTVKQEVLQYGGICLNLGIPFTHTVSLGIVPAGEYSILDATSGQSLGKLSVAIAKSTSADDFLYASVTDANVTTDESNQKTLVLTGTFPDKCMTIKDTKFHYTKDAIVVQPIADRVEDPKGCPEGRYPFTKTYALSSGLRGVALLHIRVMNGQAINKMVDLD